MIIFIFHFKKPLMFIKIYFKQNIHKRKKKNVKNLFKSTICYKEDANISIEFK